MLNWAKIPTEFIDNYINSVCVYYCRCLFDHGITPQLQSITNGTDEQRDCAESGQKGKRRKRKGIGGDAKHLINNNLLNTS